MIRALSTFRTLIEALDALGKAKRSTDALLHTACVAFVAAVAEMSGHRVTITIGQAVIARGTNE
jgi:prefoldin subunit 5